MDKGTQEEEDEGRAKKPQSGVAVIASVPLSQGGLPRIGPLDVTTVEGRAMTVIELMERLVGTDMQLVLNVDALLKDVQQTDLEWLAPLLLCCYPKDSRTLLLKRLTRDASPRLRIKLICLHNRGVTSDSFTHETVNSLLDITDEEVNTLRLVDWFRVHDQIVGSEVRNLQMCHPFTGELVDVFIVKKIFQTKAKPMLIELVSDSCGTIEPLIITKSGDDLRVDLFVMTMFRVFNALWVNYSYMFKYGQLPYCVTYEVLPFSNEKGVIEAVAHAESLASHKWEFIDKYRTVSSAIGCFIGGYMLGVRDRHEDNMLFKTDTKEILHIDFGYLFDAQTKMFDAPRVAIPSGFKSVLLEAQLWDGPFVENGVIAWQILRMHQKMLTELCEKLFVSTHPNCRDYMMKEAFLSNLAEEQQATERIKFLLENGPKSWKRLAKNFTHFLGF